MYNRFYICKDCGTILEAVNNNGRGKVCCGKTMEALKANSTDAAMEKHVPIYRKIDNKIEATIGSVVHPMEENHYIEWIELVTKNSTNRVYFKAGDLPKATFDYAPGSIIYAYCNKHSLWKCDVQ